MRKMIDFHSVTQTIQTVGREDRAMLGSNPSARTDGGNITRGIPSMDAPGPQQDDDVLARKAINP